MTAVEERVESLEHLEFTPSCDGCGQTANQRVGCRNPECDLLRLVCDRCVERARAFAEKWDGVVCSTCMRQQGKTYDDVFYLAPLR